MGEITVTLPDGSDLSVEAGATVEDVAFAIGPGLGRDTVAGVLDGDLVDKAAPVYEGARVEIVTDGSEEYLTVLRHSAAHVFAQALQRLHPEAKLTIGPPTDEGFYYDVTDVDLDQDDLEAIEAEMRDIVAADYDIERVERTREEAFELYEDNPFKRDILETEAADDDVVTFYVQDDWQDLCRGPHVESTGEIGAVKLLDISAAYWRGEEANETLTRVYGTAFESEADLDTFLERREAAAERDHRRLGRELDLFSIPEHSPGCAHYHPNGMRIRRELEDYIRETNDDLGYEEVWTPELNKADLWKPTGHYDNFTAQGEMFNWEQDDTEYGLKPMNCANHAYIYGREKRSYRDLPVRFSEFGTVYRNEQSGELSGLLRVRGMTQDDGHAFIRKDQIQGEIVDVLRAIDEIYGHFDFEAEYVLETKGDNAVGSDDIWAEATGALEDALEAEGLDYEVDDGEAAFYGPKVGVNAVDAIGRTWTIGTVQLDFNIPERLDLTYIGEDNEEHRPVMVHRALLGTFERFMGVMIEHFNGRFPLWLAPEQVRVLPVTDDDVPYAEEVAGELERAGVRVGVEDRSWTVGRKIQDAHERRVPYMLIVGSNEADSDTVSVRDRQERERQDVSLDAFVDHVVAERDEKRVEPDFLGTEQ
ncbi:threonine--tRNA ligase [Halomarina ordinaria]|uniref:Threonine--tRNA ligase n=1 Tax=Halomarina ordinaria TaxID=3033939 RepID=A0ABD5U603_9EURY|nr:threonine--tRNA ligase [Halomarina sp. PSRA2]